MFYNPNHWRLLIALQLPSLTQYVRWKSGDSLEIEIKVHREKPQIEYTSFANCATRFGVFLPAPLNFFCISKNI